VTISTLLPDHEIEDDALLKAICIGMVSATFSVSSHADSFQLKGGKLLADGMSRAEVLDVAGQPVSRETETLGASTGSRVAKTVETWEYKLQNDAGAKFHVLVRFKDGQVVAVESKQGE
jgi:hypothetical protein